MDVALRARTKGDRAENLKRSFKAGSSLEDIMPDLVKFATQTNANEPDDISKAALANISAKLSAPSKEKDPVAWAANLFDLADKCLKQSDPRVRHRNFVKVIGYCESVMEVFSREEFPDKWADVQMKLCEAYMQRVEGVRRDNMEKAMMCFDACKEVRHDETLPDDFLKKHWARGADARKAADEAAARKKKE